MKIPEIPLPEPEFTITVTHPSARCRRALVHALRFLLWGVPALAVEYALATAHGGRHSFWLTLAAPCLVLAIAVLLVDARNGGKDAL